MEVVANKILLGGVIYWVIYPLSASLRFLNDNNDNNREDVKTLYSVFKDAFKPLLSEYSYS